MFKSLSLTLSFLIASAPAIAVERPPQFVLLAFDNCQENQSWKQVSDFLDQMNNGSKDRLRYTFFLSATGLLADPVRHTYTDPMGRTGKSNINFGGGEDEVIERVRWINKLHRDGNEIASHAVGHFPGQDWSVAQWRHELDQYDYIINNVASINGLKGDKAKAATLAFSADQIRGFRAPYLQGGKNLIQVLGERRYAYDTSDSNQGWEPTTWPKRFLEALGGKGLWNFGLGFITLNATQITEADLKAGLPRQKKSIKLPAMDYNFCYRQTGGCAEKDPFKAEQDKDAQEMLVGYLNYFATNYNGNRAPVHIGHHFQQYRGGSYNRALMRFARAVCGRPEVKCTTYKELTDYMEKLGTTGRNQVQEGRFDKAAPVSIEELVQSAKLASE